MEETLEEIEVNDTVKGVVIQAANLLNLSTLDIEHNTKFDVDYPLENSFFKLSGNNYTPEHLAYYPEETFLHTYETEAKHLIEAIESKYHSNVKIYLYLFSLIKLVDKLDTDVQVERSWNRGRNLKDIYFPGLDFKVKIYIGPKAGITVKFLTINHNIYRDIFEVSNNMEQSSKEIIKLSKVIVQANTLGNKLYAKYEKKYGIK